MYSRSSVFIKNKIAVIFLLFSLLSIVEAKAQLSASPVSYGFKQDTVSVKAGETFSNTLWIENKGAIPVYLVHPVAVGKEKVGLLKVPDTIRMEPGQKKWFPLKYMADRWTIQKNLQDLDIQFRDVNNKIAVQRSATFYARLENIQGLVLDTDQQEIYLNQLTNQATVMIRCFNNGLIPISFRLDLTEIPDGLDFAGEKPDLTLEPGTQKSIPFIAKNKLNSKLAADFEVTIRALDEGGNVITLKRLRIMSVSSDRRLTLNQTPFYQNKPNTIALRYLSVDNALSAYQIQGNGKYDLSKGQQLTYQLNADYLNNPGQKGMNIYDSFIDYQNKDFGIRAGNIYESLDFNLNGKGVKGTYHIDDKRSVSLYGVDNNYLLFSDFNAPSLGNTFAMVYKENNSATDNKSLVLLHDVNLLTGVGTTLLSEAVSMPISTNQHINFETGYSLQDFRSDAGNSKNGAGIGIDYNFNGEKLNLYSDNYYSSPYYGGLRKGLLQLENKALMNLSPTENVSVRFNLLNNRPKALSYIENPFLSATNNYGSTTYELGYGNRYGKWAVNIKPYYLTQHMAVENSVPWKSSSVRSKFNVDYNDAYQSFSFEADNGYTFQNTSERPPSPFFSSRMTASYKNQVVGFSAFAQLNSYYLSDALAVSNDPKYYIYSFGPNTNFALFKQSVIVNSNAMYNYFGFNRSQNYSFDSTIRWRLKEDWAVSADVFYGLNKRSAANEYNPITGIEPQSQSNEDYGYKFDNRQFRVGIEKRFGSNDKGENKKLELVYFEDRNGNGYRDDKEPFAPNILVKVEGLAAITNSKGMVQFTGAKDKLYTVSIVNNENWSLSQTTEVFLSKNVKLEIPLIKTERLTGKLSYVADKYSDGAPSPAGLKVNAVADNGKIYSTMTNEDGEFNFYLPENKYSVSVETDGMPYSMLDGNKNVEVKHNQVAALEFKYKYASRRVDVVKFN